jgi:predicted fused transcriptional regulator/phosphomethylpyrimidine kinase
MFIREECFLLHDPASERRAVLDRLSQAVSLLGSPLDPRLIPAGGLSIGFAIRGARDSGGIAGLRNGIFTGPANPSAGGDITFDADAQITRIILTTMKFDPVIRSAAIVRFSTFALAGLESMFLECARFDPARVPPGIGTMAWGVASCCKDGVPDVIYNDGFGGNEGIIRILGEDPVVVANNILILSNRVLHSEL